MIFSALRVNRGEDARDFSAHPAIGEKLQLLLRRLPDAPAGFHIVHTAEQGIAHIKASPKAGDFNAYLNLRVHQSA